MTDILRLRLYPLLNKRSKDAIRKVTGRRGRLYSYQPRIGLLERLAEQTGMTIAQVEQELHDERQQILANPLALVYQKFD